MVTANQLNLDVLEQIFFYLTGNDRCSVALVSRAFYYSVIPRLYRKVVFRLHMAKRYPQLKSPFYAVLARKNLAIHVRQVEIHSIPILKSQHHPTFLSESTRALDLCNNLQTFKCMPNVLPLFLLSIQDKARLAELRVYANLTTTQSDKLVTIYGNLTDLCLDNGSWNIIDALPRWTPKFVNTLTTLCLYMATELKESVLEEVLRQLPGLLGLHLVGCGKLEHATVLRLVSHTPLLESLSMTTTESAAPLIKPAPSLQHLKHLALDIRCSMMSSPATPAPQVLSTILQHLQSSMPSLVSFMVRLPELKLIVGKDSIKKLVELHGSTLRTLAFIDCVVSLDSILTITESCTNLERLELPIPTKELSTFASHIEGAVNLRLIVDTDTHSGHGHGHGRGSLTQETARTLLIRAPELCKIISGKRIWKKSAPYSTDLTFERLPAYASRVSPETHWFMPRDATDIENN